MCFPPCGGWQQAVSCRTGRDTAEMTGKPAKIKGESVIKRQFAMRKSMYAAFFVFKKRKTR